jgi:integrase
VAGPPKSAAGHRTMALRQELVEILAEYMACASLTAADSDAFLFASSNGKAIRYGNFRNRVWLPAITAARCESAGFHDLRRLAATTLVLEHVDVKTAQVRLGHSDPRTTLGVYASATGVTFLRARIAHGRRSAAGILNPKDL